MLHRKKFLCSKICKQIMSLDQMRDPILILDYTFQVKSTLKCNEKNPIKICEMSAQHCQLIERWAYRIALPITWKISLEITFLGPNVEVTKKIQKRFFWLWVTKQSPGHLIMCSRLFLYKNLLSFLSETFHFLSPIKKNCILGKDEFVAPNFGNI